MRTRRKLTKTEKIDFTLTVQSIPPEKVKESGQGIPEELALDKSAKRLRQIIQNKN